MEETDVSVQIYTFLEVTAVCYGQKPVKDGQRCDFRDRYHDENHFVNFTGATFALATHVLIH